MTTVAQDRRAVARQLLLDHACSSDVEHQALRQTLELLDASPDPFARTSLPGHVTGSAIVLDEAHERVLVVWHEALQRWLQPGGHSEPDDDSPHATAIRELAEETGVRMAPLSVGGRLVHIDVHAIPARGLVPEHFHHDFRFMFTVPIFPGPPGPEPHRLDWIPVEELESRGADASLREAVACALREVR